MVKIRFALASRPVFGTMLQTIVYDKAFGGVFMQSSPSADRGFSGARVLPPHLTVRH